MQTGTVADTRSAAARAAVHGPTESAFRRSARASLTTLGALTPAGDRCIPVVEALQPLFPHGGLVRGQITGVSGGAAVSLALASVAQAVINGSWLAVIGFPALGLEAAAASGIPLQRVVAVGAPDPKPDQTELDWADRVAMCADGFEVVLAVAPSSAAAVTRRVRQRIQARGVALVLIDPEPSAGMCDMMIETLNSQWVGVGAGHGALLARMVAASTSGRRLPKHRQHRLWLPDQAGAIRAVEDIASPNDHRLVS